VLSSGEREELSGGKWSETGEEITENKKTLKRVQFE